jgi:hypothetical protein
VSSSGNDIGLTVALTEELYSPSPSTGEGKGGGDLTLEFAQPPQTIRSQGQWPIELAKHFRDTILGTVLKA